MKLPDAAKKERLLSCALELFAEKGFGGTSMRDIASRAGVAPGTAYIYFPGKEEILQILLHQSLEHIEETMIAVDHEVDDGPLQESLERYLRQVFLSWDQNRLLWRLYYMLRMEEYTNRLIGKEIETMQRFIERRITRILTVNGRKPDRSSVVLFVNALDGTFIRLMTVSRPPAAERMLKEMVQLFALLPQSKQK